VNPLKALGEFGLIDRLTGGLGTSPDAVAGIGDDCAVLRNGETVLLVTSDACIEDVHFKRDYFDPRDIGWKAAAAALSDIAAMGGTPRYVTVSLACPADIETEYLDALYAGLRDAVQAVDACVVGGDVTRSPAGIYLDIAVIGEAPKDRYRLRSGGQPGDVLAITGWPGRSAAAFELLAAGKDAGDLHDAQCRPIPRICEGAWLAARPEVHALIDCSDGLAQDTGHLARAGGLDITIDTERLPIAASLDAAAALLTHAPRSYVLRGGEDYELIALIEATSADRLRNEFADSLGVPLHIVGTASAGEGNVTTSGAEVPPAGFDHFA